MKIHGDDATVVPRSHGTQIRVAIVALVLSLTSLQPDSAFAGPYHCPTYKTWYVGYILVEGTLQSEWITQSSGTYQRWSGKYVAGMVANTFDCGWFRNTARATE